MYSVALTVSIFLSKQILQSSSSFCSPLVRKLFLRLWPGFFFAAGFAVACKKAASRGKKIKKDRGLQKDIKDFLGVSAKVRLVEPKAIPRSEGKAVRIIDKRKLK